VLRKWMIAFFLTVTAMSAVGSNGPRLGGASAEPSSWVPDPWATELPVTLGNLQGLWSVGKAPNKSFFYVRVSRDPKNPKVNYLSVTEKDATTCNIVSTGFGREEVGTRVFIEMRDPSGKRYKVMFRQYSSLQITPGEGIEANRGKITVLTIMVANANKFHNYPLIKISDRIEIPCSPEK
jgi:hypothetical protein